MTVRRALRALVLLAACGPISAAACGLPTAPGPAYRVQSLGELAGPDGRPRYIAGARADDGALLVCWLDAAVYRRTRVGDVIPCRDGWRPVGTIVAVQWQMPNAHRREHHG